MTVAFDKQVRYDGTNTLTNTFTPIGTADGIICYIDTIDSADKVSGVTYGGVAMTEVTGSPVVNTVGVGGTHTQYAYFLGSGIPAGAQSTVVTCTSAVSSGIHATFISLTAAGNTQVDDTTTIIQTVSNASVALTISQNCFCSAMMALNTTAANVSPAAGMTQIDEYAPSTGIVSLLYRTTNPTANTTIDWGSASVKESIIAIAVSEIAGQSRTMAAKADTASDLNDAAIKRGRPVVATAPTGTSSKATRANVAKGYIAKAATSNTLRSALSVGGGVTFAVKVSESHRTGLRRATAPPAPLPRAYQSKVATTNNTAAVLRRTIRRIVKVGSASSSKATISYKKILVAKAATSSKATCTLSTTTSGGGNPPAIPANITAGLPASKMAVWGSYGFVYISSSTINTILHNELGFDGYAGSPGGKYLYGAGGGNDYVAGDAAGAVGSQYDWCKAFQGYGIPAINGGNTGLGILKSRQTLGHDAWLGCYMHEGTQTNGGLDSNGAQTHPPWGDWFDDTKFATIAASFGRLAGTVAFMGGTGITVDFEATSTNNNWRSNPKAGVTALQQAQKAEARGYQFGTALWTNHPSAELIIYSWQAPGQWFRTTQPGLSDTPTVVAESAIDQFCFGMARAMKDLNSTGKYIIWDAGFYKPTSQTAASLADALKANNSRILASFSTYLPAATRNYLMPRLMVQYPAWAGSDGAQFYVNVVGDAGHTPEPMFANQHAVYRQWSMGGRRWEYMGPSATDGTPLTYTIAGVQGSAYRQAASTPNPPGAHSPGMRTNASTTSHDTLIP